MCQTGAFHVLHWDLSSASPQCPEAQFQFCSFGFSNDFRLVL